MDMRSGGFPRNGLAKQEKGDAVLHQVGAQPLALGSVRVQAHVHPPAVVEAHGPVYRGFPHRAYGHGLSEMLLVSRFNARKSHHIENAVAIESLGDGGSLGGSLGKLCIKGFLASAICASS